MGGGDGDPDVVQTTRLALKVVPGASRDAIAGGMGEALRVRVRQPPERGRANEAVIGLLAEALGVERSRVRIVQGATSPRKVAEIDGLDADHLRARLGADPTA